MIVPSWPNWKHSSFLLHIANKVANFLSGRSLKAKVDDALYPTLIMSNRVPEGSVLGPLLFLMFIIDVIVSINSRCYMFADHLN